MKKITLLVIMIVTAFTLNAQSLVKYHGEIIAEQGDISSL